MAKRKARRINKQEGSSAAAGSHLEAKASRKRQAAKQTTESENITRNGESGSSRSLPTVYTVRTRAEKQLAEAQGRSTVLESFVPLQAAQRNKRAKTAKPQAQDSSSDDAQVWCYTASHVQHFYTL